MLVSGWPAIWFSPGKSPVTRNVESGHIRQCLSVADGYGSVLGTNTHNRAGGFLVPAIVTTHVQLLVILSNSNFQG